MKLHLSIITISWAVVSLLSQPLYAQSESDTDEDLRRTVLPPAVNTPFVEVRPLISPDGKTLYFGRREHPDNIKKERDLQDIYVSQKNAKGWTQAQNLGDVINNKFANSICSVSPDGEQILVMNTYKKAKGPLVTFTKNGDDWVGPVQLDIEGYYNNSEYIDFYMDFENEVLFMAIEREDGRGQQDLYVSFKQEGEVWSKPLNMGPNINSTKADFAPFLASDGRTLFFCSYGHNGLGGADIYYSHRLDDSYTNWSLPVNMGKPVNTSGEETYVSATIDLKTLYFVSYRHGSAKRDIISTPLVEEVLDLPPLQSVEIPVALADEPELQLNKPQRLNTTSETEEVEDEPEDMEEAFAQNEETVPEDTEELYAEEEVEETDSEDLVAGNTTTEPEIETSVEEENSARAITVSDNTSNDQPFSTTNTARVVVSQSGNVKTYTLNTKQGNTEVEIPAALPARAYASSKNETALRILKNMYFNFNQITLKPGQNEQYLGQIMQVLTQNPNVKLKVIGHADEKGTSIANLFVSRKRAEAVKSYLESQGIDSKRLEVDYKGESEPLASNDDDREGRELNRRVEFEVILP